MATLEPSDDRDIELPDQSPAASPSISLPSCDQLFNDGGNDGVFDG